MFNLYNPNVGLMLLVLPEAFCATAFSFHIIYVTFDQLLLLFDQCAQSQVICNIPQSPINCLLYPVQLLTNILMTDIRWFSSTVPFTCYIFTVSLLISQKASLVSQLVFGMRKINGKGRELFFSNVHRQ